MNSKNMSAIITGGSSGIGLSIINRLSKEGIKAVSWDIQPPEDKEIPFFECDVTSEKSVLSAYHLTQKQYGTPGILINNCGLQYLSKIEEFPLEKWKLLMDVLLTGTFLCTKVVLGEMKKREWGRIINISSIHGKIASPYKAAYVAAKHGVMGLTKVTALEGAPFITANAICPGFVDTPLMRNQLKSQADLNHLSESEVLEKIFLKESCIKELIQVNEIAEMVIYLISPAANKITGEGFNLSGGWGMGL